MSLQPYDDNGEFYDDNIIIKNVMEPLTQSIASISLICSSTIILTALLFPIMLRKKPFMQMFLTIAITDFVSNLFLLFGYPHNTTCRLQGAVFIFTQRAIFFWLTALTYQLFDVSINGKLRFSMLFLQFFIWGISIFLELIVFINDMYGVDYNSMGLQICLLEAKYSNNGDSTTSFKYWIFLVLVVPLAICIIIIFILLWKISRRYVSSVNIKVLISTFWRYPLVLIALWTPYFIILVIFVASQYHSKIKHLYSVYDFTLALIPMFGIYQATTFFAKSIEARIRWSNLFIGIFFPSKEQFALELGSNNSHSTRDDIVTEQATHNLSISRGFSFDLDDEHLSSITKSSFLLNSFRTADSLGDMDTANVVKSPMDINRIL